MSQMIESMESRTLFTVSIPTVEADVTALVAAGTQAKSDLTADLKVAAADTKAIKSAALAAHPSGTQKASLTAFLKAEAADAGKLKKQISKILANGTRSGHQLTSALRNFKAHPSSATAQAKAIGAVTALQTIFSPTVVAEVEGNVAGAAATLSADATAVGLSIPSSQSEVDTFNGHLSSFQTTVSTDATRIQDAITSLEVDLSA